MPAIESTRAATRWTTRIVPVFLTAAVAYATYVVVARICCEYIYSSFPLHLSQSHGSRHGSHHGSRRTRATNPVLLLTVEYLLRSLNENGTATAILVLYFVFLLLMIGTYARTFYNANFNPGVVPLGPRAAYRLRAKAEKQVRRSYGADDIEGRAYEAGPDNDPDSPGLESFYSRDAFVCETDGRPKWCSECCNWKHDRVHHSREIGRCVYRMDHYCPWAGGMIGENSFKFFVQFTTYASLFCAVVLGANGYALRRQAEHGASPDPFFLAATVIAAFFGLFAFLMTVTSARYIHQNMTNVDILSFRQKVYQLAVRVPRGTRSDRFGVVVYPLTKLESGSGGRKGGAKSLKRNDLPSEEQADALPASSRDDLAKRTFAILETGPGENPWDLGPWRNWQSVMGTNPVDWVLPIRHSPCADHESLETLYGMDRILDQLRNRYGLPAGPPSDESTVMEMRNLRSQ
ncbi:hypothetical protein E0Z10_g8462 [Xylaria hypoxylon]|uniref:Palmitoyltransferase n=1 Tax=Xylaria hypoxylon TaxID=37992 RepID=A0A4Z0YNW8_9PEZI|nr:hypothetical protein E0Z10_g8462 [Xylaria hypoxylon]